MTDEERRTLARPKVLVGPKGTRVETTLATTLAGQLDLDIEGGRTHTLRLSWIDADTAEVYDLGSGYTAKLQVRSYPGASTAHLSLTEAAGITLASTEPNITIVVTAAQATTLAAAIKRGSYDLLVTETGGAVWRLLEGTVAARSAVST